MKKIFISAVFVMGVLSASAQTSSSNTNTATTNANYASRVSTDKEIRDTANRLQLNEGQYIRFRDLSRARNEQLREANNMYANDAAGLQARLNTINKTFEIQLAQEISSKQFTAYLESQGRANGAIGTSYQAGGYGGSSLEGGSATGTSTNGGAVNSNTNSSGTINNSTNVSENANPTNEPTNRKEKKKKKARNKNIE